MNKKIVWDLFGGGQNSVYNALNKNEYDIYTFDLVPEPEHDKQFVIDLAQDFHNLKEYFSKLPKPDIIVASPLCQSFSSILSLKGGGTHFWEYKDNTKTKLKERSIKDFERLKTLKSLNAETQLFKKRLGEKCINNTIDLIKEFKPKFWYIENPKNSLIWKYIQFNRNDFYKNDYVFNKCFYSAYDFYQPKPTIFLSNINLDLINKNTLKVVKDNKYKYFYDDKNNLITKMHILDKIAPKMRKTKFKNEGNFQGKESAAASSIPKKLIQAIFNKFKEETNE